MNREAMLTRIRERTEPWDIIVIGGGATGAGVAVDAASRGLSVLLLEREDFAKGTSSRSTKLVHGGVRYLEQGNISLVMEALKERGLLRQQRASSGARCSVRRAQLLLVGGAVLRHRPEDLRPARRQIWLWQIRDPLPRRDSGTHAQPCARTDCVVVSSITTVSSTTRAC